MLGESTAVTQHRRGRRLLVGAAGLTGIAMTAAAVFIITGVGAGDRSAVPHAGPPQPAHAIVERMTLMEHKTLQGTLGYAGSTQLSAGTRGRVTWLPKSGRVVRQGQRLYQVDGKDVILLYGAKPAYRLLKAGDKGADVRQFEAALAALGYGGFTVDEEYSAATAEAVRRWQKHRGWKSTGQADPTTLAYAPGKVRVADRKTGLGQMLTAGAQVLILTSLRHVVTAPVKVEDSVSVRKGADARVTLPGGSTIKGTVTSVGSVVKKTKGPTGDTQDTLDVVVDVRDSSAVRRFVRAPVDVSLDGMRRPDVLTVPVSALIALPGGGYGVTVLGSDGSRRDVKVTTGMFADGKVEVNGSGLTAGTKVEVAR